MKREVFGARDESIARVQTHPSRHTSRHKTELSLRSLFELRLEHHFFVTNTGKEIDHIRCQDDIYNYHHQSRGSIASRIQEKNGFQ